MESLDPKRIRPGKIKHKRLNPELEKIARHTFRVVGHLAQPTYEQWELDFLRDQNPQRELSKWLVISDAFEAAKAERPHLNEKTILGDLVLISVGGQSQYGLKETYLKAGMKYQRGKN